MSSGRNSRFVLAAVLALFLTTGANAATFLDPALRFRTIETEHFAIYFHQGEERLAARLAAIAERVWTTVGRDLGTVAPRRTHVILADQSELANGWATPVPYNTIFVTAAVPPGSEFIGRVENWLEVVFTHEFTHIVHLDRSVGWARLFRGVFGRTPIAFPNLWLPTWQIEGLATWEESTRTAGGRLQAGDFRAIERQAARGGAFAPIDRVNGGLTDWPGGLATYAYGLGFHEYLADRFGVRFADLAARTSRSLPFFSAGAFRDVYGQPLDRLWDDYTRARIDSTSDEPRLQATQLTHRGFTVLGPRFAPPACESCPAEIFYSVRNPGGFPAIESVQPDGGNPRHVERRYLGTSLSATGRVLLFDQQEIRRNAGVYSDLYLLDRRSGAVHALTHNARLLDPDLSPDGRRIVCVREERGRRDLVLLTLDSSLSTAEDLRRVRVEATTVLASLPDGQFNTPRWSPNGSSIAAVRHDVGGQSELVLIDPETADVRALASNAASRFVTPAWRPDGQAVIAAADTPGGVFNLYEFSTAGPASPPRTLTSTTNGALWPDVSPDGATLVFVGYTEAGFDLFTMPYPDASTDRRSPLALALQPAPTTFNDTPSTAAETRTSAFRSYSPWPTLRPTAWFPTLENNDRLRAGFATGGADVLGRHSYFASASWLLERGNGEQRPSAFAADWSALYAYARWRPTYFVSASRDTLFAGGPPDAAGRPLPVTVLQREVEAGVLLPIRRVRMSHRGQLSLVRISDNYRPSALGSRQIRTAIRAAAATTTAQLYGYSVSPEDGFSAGVTAEMTRRAFGATADATAVTADVRAYLRGFGPHHVLAVRAAGGSSSGPPAVGRTFLMGGADSAEDVIDFGRGAVSLLRGFPANRFAGTHAALLNVDYRWPLARPQRGYRTWPLFVNTVHASLFSDVGNAWSGALRARDLKMSAGGELAVNMVAGYSFPFTATVGAAWGHDRTTAQNRSTLYVRIGRAF